MPPADQTRSRWWITALALALAAGLVVLWAVLWRERDEPARQTRTDDAGNQQGGTTEGSGPVARPPVPRLPPSSLVTSGEALHAALREDVEYLDSGLVIEDIDLDRSWVCTGEPIRLSARMGGQPEPDAVYRWVWAKAEGSVELQPGPMLEWQAPVQAGRYPVRFQACKDLGGRRVGVLAERVIEIEVRACTEEQGQDHEPLRIAISQRRHGVFAFHALSLGDEHIEEYAWDFGDGTALTTSEPVIEHAYAVQDLGPHDSESYPVKLEARLASGARLEATAFALTRGRPPQHEPPPVELEISRWRPRPDGNGWQSTLVVRNPSESEITWDRLERITTYFDERVNIDTLEWRDVIVVEESLTRGGFRGQVIVDAAAAGPDVKQIHDFLYGHDASGEEVMVSWTPFKREPSPRPAGDVARPPAK